MLWPNTEKGTNAKSIAQPRMFIMFLSPNPAKPEKKKIFDHEITKPRKTPLRILGIAVHGKA